MSFWREYNRKLTERARVDIYLSQEAIENWRGEKGKGRGKTRKYSDIAIMTCLAVRYAYNVTYRGAQGLMESLVKLGEIGLEIPKYSQLNRRQKELGGEEIRRKLEGVRDKRSKERKIIAIDSTGLSVTTPGKWYCKKHGYKGDNRKDKWIKLHAAIDVENKAVVDYSTSDSTSHDSKIFCKMLKQARLAKTNMQELLGDGAYDSGEIYKELYEREIKPNIKVRSDGVISASDQNLPHLRARDKLLHNCFFDKFTYPHLNKKGLIRRRLFEENKHGRRSLVENFFARFKSFFSDKLSSKTQVNIQKEIDFKLAILNLHSTS